MPSPVAHGLAGLALVWLFRYPVFHAPRPKGPGRGVPGLVIAGAIFMASIAADFDFFPGFLVGEPGRFHRGPTHSLGAAVIFGIASVFVARWCAIRTPRRFGLFLGLVFASHAVLDLLTIDFGEQTGIPLWWPVAADNVVSPVHVFLYIQRARGLGTFVTSQLSAHNFYAVMWELAVMGVLLVVVKLAGAGPSNLWRRATAWLDRGEGT